MLSSVSAFRSLVLFLFIWLAALHAAGFAYSLYYHWWWYDIFMHILGGFTVGMLTVYVFFLRRDRSAADVKKFFITIFLSILVVGILWEIFEYSISVYYGVNWFGMIDTIADMINDLLGAFAGAALFLKFHNKQPLRQSHEIKSEEVTVEAEKVEAKILL